MRRQWDSEECCISTSFTQLKVRTLHTCCFRGEGFRLAAQREITKRKRVFKVTKLFQKLQSYKITKTKRVCRMRVDELPEYIRGISCCVSTSFTQLQISTFHTCCWGTFRKKTTKKQRRKKIKKKKKKKKN